MKLQNQQFKPNNFSTFIILLFFLFGGVNTSYGQKTIKGTIDLRESKTLDNDVIDLSGEWQFSYGNHFSSFEMDSIQKDNKVYLKIPSSWTSITKNGKKIPAFGIGTYYLRIILDKKQKQKISKYGFSIGNIVTAYKLWVNGNLVTQAGLAAATSEKFKPIYLPQSCFFNSETDTLKVIIHVSNFYDPIYAGLWQKIYIGTQEKIIHFDSQNTTFTLFIFSAFLLLFFYQLSLSFVQKNVKSHIIIALLSLSSMIKMLLDGPISIYNFIPNLDFTIYYRFWLYSFFIIYFILRLTKISFPAEINNTIVKVFNWLYGIAAVAFVFVDIELVLNSIILIVYANLICLGYIFFVLSKAVIRGRSYSVITLIGFTIMAMFVLNDLIFVVTQTSYGYLSHVGVIIYIIIQSISISLKFAKSHDLVLKLSAELMDANRNLEAQVEDRTKDLNQVNGELAIINKQKDFLISTISHDLMGFFNTMLIFSKFLHQDKALIDKQHEISTKLYQTSYKGYYMLDNILAWAKMHITYKKEMVAITNLTAIIEENIYLLADQITDKSLKTEIEINNELCFVSSVDNLHTIIRNILSNAIKFSHEGGKIRFSSKNMGDTIQIIFHDDGIGMTNEIQQTVFDPEINKRREGTNGERGSGLGLLIVKELVESNQGRISCISKLNSGTQFILEFPKYNILKKDNHTKVTFNN